MTATKHINKCGTFMDATSVSPHRNHKFHGGKFFKWEETCDTLCDGY